MTGDYEHKADYNREGKFDHRCGEIKNVAEIATQGRTLQPD
jgi:hypothetical protein